MARGLALIEVLVTLNLLAVVAAGTFGLYATGFLASQHAQNLAIAAGLVQARMEQVKANPDVLTGATDDSHMPPAGIPGYRWATAVERVAPGLAQVTVTVSWTWRGRPRQASLTTLLRTDETP